MQCIQSYSSQEPDELSIEMADVLNLLERTDDGKAVACKHKENFVLKIMSNYILIKEFFCFAVFCYFLFPPLSFLFSTFQVG